jgi:hypothetical protein
MDNLQIELAKLRRDANLTESIQDVDKILEQLEAARESIVQGESLLPVPGRKRRTQEACLSTAPGSSSGVYLLIMLRRFKLSAHYSCKTTKSSQTWLR